MDLEVPPSSSKGLASHPECVCSDLAEFPGLRHCSSSGFLLSPKEPKTVHQCDLILSVFSSVFAGGPACESGMYSRIIYLGRENFVDENTGAFLLVLVAVHLTEVIH